MRPENNVWQENFCYWQDGFIHANLLMIGYTGWRDFSLLDGELWLVMWRLKFLILQLQISKLFPFSGL